MAKSQAYPPLSDQLVRELRRCIVDCYTQVPPDALTGRRLQVIRDLHRGFSVKYLSKTFRVSVRSIRQWLAAYRRDGIKGLMGKPRPGVHLTREQIDQLRKLRLERRKRLPRPNPVRKPSDKCKNDGHRFHGDIKKLSNGAKPSSAQALLGALSNKRHVRRPPWSFPRLARWVAAHWGIKVSPKQLTRKMYR